MRHSLVIGLLFVALSACQVIEVPFATDPSIMRGAWTGTIAPVCQTRLSGLSWSPDGARIATLGDALRLWNANSGALEYTIVTSADLDHFGWNADGTKFGVAKVTAGIGIRTEVYDTATASLMGTQDLAVPYPLLIAFNRDLSKLAVVIEASSRDFTLVLWNLQTGIEQRRVRLGSEGYASSMAFSPDGSKVVVVTGNKIRLDDAGSTLGTLEFFSGATPQALAWNADGTQLTAFGAGKARTWRVSDGAALRDTDFGSAYAPTISLDAKRLALMRYTGLEVWNLETGAKLFELPGERVEHLAFNPDLSKLAFGSPNRCTLSILNASNGAVAGSILLEPSDPIRTISLELQAQYVNERGYSITGTATVQGEPAYTVQGQGYMGSGQILKLTPPPLPQSVQIALRDQAGTIIWGKPPTDYGQYYAQNTLIYGGSKYEGAWANANSKTYALSLKRAQP
jgi:WD40 repeat protein